MICMYSSNTPGDSGISPRAVRELVRITQQELTSEWSYDLSFSMLEIYNETIRDLLVGSSGSPITASSNKLDVRQTSAGNTVPGLVEIQVSLHVQLSIC